MNNEEWGLDTLDQVNPKREEKVYIEYALRLKEKPIQMYNIKHRMWK